MAETSCIAQIHLEPVNGANGIPGPVTSSFIIKWASFDSILYYEYIVSDNPLCFEGCPGDTRQNITPDTVATEYNFQEGKMYYWVTRMHYLNGDTSYWSTVPSSFLAKTPPESNPDEIVTILPNPCVKENITFKIDWYVNPKAREMNISVYSVFGVKIYESNAKKEGNRYQELKLDVSAFTKGSYITIFTLDDNPNNPNNRITKKIIIQ
jgi:Secretion system C-terminal sorting domain